MADLHDGDVLAELRQRSQALRADAVRRLEMLVGMESPSGDAERLTAVRVALAERMTELGAIVETVFGPDGGHLRASFGPAREAGSHLLLVGHFDTVWPVGTLARRPFRAVGDWASGPGTLDMKGAIVAVELAVRLVSDMGLPFAQPAQLVLVCDEEISSPDGRHLVLEAAAGASAVLGLEPPHPNGDLKHGRRGVARIRIDVEGRESHSGLDAAKGISAVDELVDQLLHVRTALAEGQDVSCNVGRIAGGTRANVVAGRASAELGLRFATQAAERAVMAMLANLRPTRPGARVSTTVLSTRPAWQPAADDWLVTFVRGQAERLGETIGARSAGGAGDTNFTGASGVPTVDGLGPSGHGAHSADEKVMISSILRRAELLALLFVTKLPHPR